MEGGVGGGLEWVGGGMSGWYEDFADCFGGVGAIRRRRGRRWCFRLRWEGGGDGDGGMVAIRACWLAEILGLDCG